MKSLDLMQALSQVLHWKKALKCFNNSYFKQRTILSTGCWGQATSCSNFAQFSCCEYCIKYSFLQKEKKNTLKGALQQQLYLGVNMQF